MTLAKLLKKNRLQYINKHITEENYPFPTDFKMGTYALFYKTNNICHEIEAMMERMSFRPANLYELLDWGGSVKDGTVAALGAIDLEIEEMHYMPVFTCFTGKGLCLRPRDCECKGYQFLGVKIKPLVN